MDTPLLWHIPLSYFNENLGWALDYKGIGNRRKVLGLDDLVLAWHATGRGTLPIPFLDGRAIGDSTHIITALEDRLPSLRCILVTPPPGSALFALEELAPALRAVVVAATREPIPGAGGAGAVFAELSRHVATASGRAVGGRNLPIASGLLRESPVAVN